MSRRSMGFLILAILALILVLTGAYFLINNHVEQHNKEFTQDCHDAGFRMVHIGNERLCVGPRGEVVARR